MNVVIMIMYDYVSAYKRTNVGEQSGARFTFESSSKPMGCVSLSCLGRVECICNFILYFMCSTQTRRNKHDVRPRVMEFCSVNLES